LWIGSLLQKELGVKLDVEQILKEVMSNAAKILAEKNQIDQAHKDCIALRMAEKELFNETIENQQMKGNLNALMNRPIARPPLRTYDERRIEMKRKAFIEGKVSLEEARVFLEKEQLHVVALKAELYRLNLKIYTRNSQRERVQSKFGNLESILLKNQKKIQEAKLKSNREKLIQDLEASSTRIANQYNNIIKEMNDPIFGKKLSAMVKRKSAVEREISFVFLNILEAFEDEVRIKSCSYV
jgi:hypothetical protein